MAWHEQRENVEQLIMHGELDELAQGSGETDEADIETLAAAGFQVVRRHERRAIDSG